MQGFLNTVKQLNLRNSIFVDVTSNSDLANLYPEYLKHSIAIVACNKIACSNDFKDYKQLKRLLELNLNLFKNKNLKNTMNRIMK